MATSAMTTALRSLRCLNMAAAKAPAGRAPLSSAAEEAQSLCAQLKYGLELGLSGRMGGRTVGSADLSPRTSYEVRNSVAAPSPSLREEGGPG